LISPQSLKKARNRPPRFEIIAKQLLHAVQSGEFPVGSLLPTEKELCVQFSTSRHTARAALKYLQTLGVISRKQGSGSTVQAAEAQVKYNQFVQSIEDLLEYGESTHFKILSSQHILTDDYLSNLLDCETQIDCVCLRGLRFENQSSTPFCSSEIYRLPHADASDPEIENTEQAIIDELQLDHISRVEQNITAVPLNDFQARALQITSGIPAMRMVRRYFGLRGELLLVAVSTHPGKYYTYSTTFVQPG